MKKTLIIITFGTLLFSCKENKDSSNTKIEQVETEKTVVKSRKFEDTKDCSQYTNLYNALPHLDTYKDLEFGEIDCSKDGEGYSKALNVTYYNNNSKTSITNHLFETSGTDRINTAKASFNTLTKIPSSNTFKSSLTIFENASVNISQSENEKEPSKATYLGTFKDKYSIWINIEMLGKIDVVKIDTFLKEYLEEYKKEELN